MPTLIYMHTHTCAHAHTHTHTHTDSWGGTCTHAHAHTHTHTHTQTVGEVHPKYLLSRNNVAFLWFVLDLCFLLNSSAVSGQIPDLFLPSLQVNTEQLRF